MGLTLKESSGQYRNRTCLPTPHLADCPRLAFNHMSQWVLSMITTWTPTCLQHVSRDSQPIQESGTQSLSDTVGITYNHHESAVRGYFIAFFLHSKPESYGIQRIPSTKVTRHGQSRRELPHSFGIHKPKAYRMVSDTKRCIARHPLSINVLTMRATG